MTDEADGTPPVRRKDIIAEIMTMRGVGFQVAKSIRDLSEKPPDTFKQIGPRVAGGRRPMSQSEALRIVTAAKESIALADEGD